MRRVLRISSRVEAFDEEPGSVGGERAALGFSVRQHSFGCFGLEAFEQDVTRRFFRWRIILSSIFLVSRIILYAREEFACLAAILLILLAVTLVTLVTTVTRDIA